MGPHSLDQRVTALETKDEADENKCDARHGTANSRLDKLETAMWGENRDGEGGVVNRLNSTITKVAILTGLTSFAGSAVGMVIISHLASKAGFKQ